MDLAIEMQDPLSAFLRQPVAEQSSVEAALRGLLQLKQAAAQRSAAAKPQAATAQPNTPHA